MKAIVLLALTSFLSFVPVLHCQHPEDFLGIVLGDDWLSVNEIERVEAKIRWANVNGKLRGGYRTDYVYLSSGEYYLPEAPENRLTTRTDSSETQCILPKQGNEYCTTSIYRAGRLIRIEDGRSTRYMQYDMNGQLSGIWCDNGFHIDSGSDHVIIYEYDETGRLHVERELSLRCYKEGDYYDNYRSFKVWHVVEAELIYSDNGSLETVYMSKGETQEDLEIYRVLRYHYDENGFPSKTKYFHLTDGREIQAFEVKYIYR